MTERTGAHAPAITRRGIMQSGLAAGAMGAGGASLAQDGAESPGPPVWLDMDQAALDAAYDQFVWLPNLLDFAARFDSRSEATRARLGEPRRPAYGDDPIEALDLFEAQTPERPAPIHIFIHGGAWQGGSAAGHAFVAEAFVDRGAHFMAPDFADVRDVGGDLGVLADQVRRSIAWVYRNAESFGGDRERIFISGHSSGGHLAAVALSTDWEGAFGLPADVLKGGVIISGMYDLEPVSLSARRDYLALTDEMVEALSPQRHLDRITAPLIVGAGTLESPEFQRHSVDFAAAMQAAGKPVTHLTGAAYNHMNILETLADPYGLFGRPALAQMGLG